MVGLDAEGEKQEREQELNNLALPIEGYVVLVSELTRRIAAAEPKCSLDGGSEEQKEAEEEGSRKRCARLNVKKKDMGKYNRHRQVVGLLSAHAPQPEVR